MGTIGFIGAGKMAGALIGGMLEGGLADAAEVVCFDVRGEAVEALRDRYGVRGAEDAETVVREADILFLGFKPQNFPQAVVGLADLVREDQVIVSILAGVRIGKIREAMGGQVVRVMPNTACLVGAMAAGYAAAENVSAENIAAVRAILTAAGVAVQVEEEELDAVTGLSGSGPAFVAYLIEAFIAGGMHVGLDAKVSRDLALQTFLGTAKLLQQWQMEPRDLIAMVSSPNGTTVAGREVLEESDVQEVIKDTIERAAQRSRELGA